MFWFAWILGQFEIAALFSVGIRLKKTAGVSNCPKNNADQNCSNIFPLRERMPSEPENKLSRNLLHGNQTLTVIKDS